MLCDLKNPLFVSGPEPADPMERIVSRSSMPQARAANDDTPFRPCLLERRRRRLVRRQAH